MYANVVVETLFCNIASGVMIGSAFGPPRMAVGALGGFMVWGVGEAVGGFVDGAVSENTTSQSDGAAKRGS